VMSQVFEPVLSELEKFGIKFHEENDEGADVKVKEKVQDQSHTANH